MKCLEYFLIVLVTTKPLEHTLNSTCSPLNSTCFYYSYFLNDYLVLTPSSF